MSETLKTLIESLLMIAGTSAGIVWYAIWADRQEDRGAPSSKSKPRKQYAVKNLNPDAHLGRSGSE